MAARHVASYALDAAAASRLDTGLRRHGAGALQRAASFGSTSAWREDIAASPIVTAALPLTRVYYSARHLTEDAVERSLIDIPAIAINGDGHVCLQNGDNVSLRSSAGLHPGLLTPAERLRARKKAIVSMDKVYAHGGYGGSSLKPYAPAPALAVIASIAGAQFEMQYLEASHFILHPELPPAVDDAFLPYYDVDAAVPFNGRVPRYEEAAAYVHSHPAQQAFVPFSFHGLTLFLYLAAYENAVAEDMLLLLRALDDWSTELLASGAAAAALAATLPPQLWVQLPAVGLGFFADYCNSVNLADWLRPAFLRGLRRALACGELRHIAVLELLDFTHDKSFDLQVPAVGSVRIEHSRRSLLQFSPDQLRDFTCVAVNAGDAFAFPGNEYGYASVESMVGENTSIRRTQVYLHNVHMLNASHWRSMQVTVPPQLRE